VSVNNPKFREHSVFKTRRICETAQVLSERVLKAGVLESMVLQSASRHFNV